MMSKKERKVVIHILTVLSFIKLAYSFTYKFDPVEIGCKGFRTENYDLTNPEGHKEGFYMELCKKPMREIEYDGVKFELYLEQGKYRYILNEDYLKSERIRNSYSIESTKLINADCNYFDMNGATKRVCKLRNETRYVFSDTLKTKEKHILTCRFKKTPQDRYAINYFTYYYSDICKPMIIYEMKVTLISIFKTKFEETQRTVDLEIKNYSKVLNCNDEFCYTDDCMAVSKENVSGTVNRTDIHYNKVYKTSYRVEYSVIYISIVTTLLYIMFLFRKTRIIANVCVLCGQMKFDNRHICGFSLEEMQAAVKKEKLQKGFLQLVFLFISGLLMIGITNADECFDMCNAYGNDLSSFKPKVTNESVSGYWVSQATDIRMVFSVSMIKVAKSKNINLCEKEPFNHVYCTKDKKYSMPDNYATYSLDIDSRMNKKLNIFTAEQIGGGKTDHYTVVGETFCHIAKVSQKKQFEKTGYFCAIISPTLEKCNDISGRVFESGNECEVEIIPVESQKKGISNIAFCQGDVYKIEDSDYEQLKLISIGVENPFIDNSRILSNLNINQTNLHNRLSKIKNSYGAFLDDFEYRKNKAGKMDLLSRATFIVKKKCIGTSDNSNIEGECGFTMARFSNKSLTKYPEYYNYHLRQSISTKNIFYRDIHTKSNFTDTTYLKAVCKKTKNQYKLSINGKKYVLPCELSNFPMMYQGKYGICNNSITVENVPGFGCNCSGPLRINQIDIYKEKIIKTNISVFVYLIYLIKFCVLIRILSAMLKTDQVLIILDDDVVRII